MSTTLCDCIKITRKDAVVVGMTTLNETLVISGVTYKSIDGYTPTSTDESNAPSIGNFDFNGFINSTSAITKDDILKGKYDGARVHVFEYDYVAKTVTFNNIFDGYLGDFKVKESTFECEARSLQQLLMQDLTKKYSPTCRAELGDSQCKVNLAGFTFSGIVTSVSSRQAFTASALAQAAGYFKYGLVTWLTGNNAGFTVGIADHTSGGVIKQFIQMSKNIQVGDTFTIIAGCDKLASTCKTKFSNKINFRGEDMLPGPDKMLG
jgi:uncharacterized phage protein (TIGR02218 family)